MNRKKLLVSTTILFAIGLCIFTGLSYLFASVFIAPVHHPIGAPPKDFSYLIKNVSFKTDDGIVIKGWYAPPAANQGAIILLHGYKADRSVMVERAEMLRSAGFGV